MDYMEREERKALLRAAIVQYGDLAAWTREQFGDEEVALEVADHFDRLVEIWRNELTELEVER